MPNYPARCCRWCAAGFTPRHPSQDFCCPEHGKLFNNLRMVRGAELYDLFCGMRSERALAKELDVWTEMCRLELRWKQEDGAHRRYLPLKTALMRLYETGRLMLGEIVAKAHRVGR